ncbi:MAG: hypothetical protein ABI594_01495 [Ginsengibacter sp.]
MGLIREPKGVDFIVGPSIVTNEDKKMISDIIANYKKTGKLPSKQKKQTSSGGRRSITHIKSIVTSGAGRR